MTTIPRKTRTPTTVQAQAMRERQLRAAMADLIRLPSFGHFIDYLRDMRENAITDSINDAVASSDRLSLVAKGEVRCYTDIIRTYDESFARLSEETGNT